jgi:hypothetical protein
MNIKSLLFVGMASVLSAAIGSVLVSLFIGGIGLWPSVMVVAVPLCLIFGVGLGWFWLPTAAKRGTRVVVYGRMVIGGASGASVALITMLRSGGHFESRSDIAVVFGIWISIGAICGVVYSVLLKWILATARRRREQKDLS